MKAVRRRPPSTLLALVSFLTTGSVQMVGPVLAIYAHDHLHASIEEVGVVVAALFISSVVFKVPLVFAMGGDRILQALFLGVVLNAVSPLGYFLAPTIPTLIIFRILHGLALALDYTSFLTLSALVSAEREVAASVGRYATATAAGLMVGPILSTASVAFLGLSFTLLLASAVALPSIPFALLFARRVGGVWVGPTLKKPRLREIVGTAKTPGLLLATGIYLTFSFSWGVLLAYAPLIAKLNLHLTDADVTALFIGYYTATFLTRTTLSILPRFEVGRMLRWALTSFMAGFVLLGVGNSASLFAAGFLFAGAAHGIIFPVTAILVARTVPTAFRNIANAFYLTAFDLGAMMGPLMASPLASRVGLQIAVGAAALAPLLGVILTRWIKRLGVD